MCSVVEICDISKRRRVMFKESREFFMKFKDFNQHQVSTCEDFMNTCYRGSSYLASNLAYLVREFFKGKAFDENHVAGIDTCRVLRYDDTMEVIASLHCKVLNYMEMSYENDFKSGTPSAYKHAAILSYMYSIVVVCRGLRQAISMMCSPPDEGHNDPRSSSLREAARRVAGMHLEEMMRTSMTKDLKENLVNVLFSMCTASGSHQTIKNAMGASMTIVFDPKFPMRESVEASSTRVTVTESRRQRIKESTKRARDTTCDGGGAVKRLKSSCDEVALVSAIPAARERLTLGMNFGSKPLSTRMKRLVITSVHSRGSDGPPPASICVHVPSHLSWRDLREHIHGRYEDVAKYMEFAGFNTFMMAQDVMGSRLMVSTDRMYGCVGRSSIGTRYNALVLGNEEQASVTMSISLIFKTTLKDGTVLYKPYCIVSPSDVNAPRGDMHIANKMTGCITEKSPKIFGFPIGTDGLKGRVVSIETLGKKASFVIRKKHINLNTSIFVGLCRLMTMTRCKKVIDAYSHILTGSATTAKWCSFASAGRERNIVVRVE